MEAFESVSTWRQPVPPAASSSRSDLVTRVATEILARSERRLRVAVDGRTAAGKTSFAHELAAAVRALGRPTLRASLDDFKHPWQHASEHGYDRVSGVGYYRNAHDHASVRRLLLEPAGPSGSGQVVLCAHDPLTGRDHRDVVVRAGPDAVLIVDTVFAFRPEWDDLWDYRIWLEVAAVQSLDRGVARDSSRDGADEATRVHRDRYAVAEAIYLAEVGPVSRADVVIDNHDWAAPFVIR
ncbi:uridine kinase [Nocardioides aquiterrae]|uniref:Uridine kinase n=1 Tax=Nocardioides aquiterrae TaxID=203799 RepID=A0ABN1UFA0_9ACTN